MGTTPAERRELALEEAGHLGSGSTGRALECDVGDVAVDERVATKEAVILEVVRCFVANADAARSWVARHAGEHFCVLAEVRRAIHVIARAAAAADEGEPNR